MYQKFIKKVTKYFNGACNLDVKARLTFFKNSLPIHVEFRATSLVMYVGDVFTVDFLRKH